MARGNFDRRLLGKPRRPLVVLDWNLFETASLSDLRAPNGWDFLLPDEVIHEVLNKPDTGKKTSASLFNKLLTFRKLYASRTWLSMPAHVATFYSKPIHINRIIHYEATNHFRSRETLAVTIHKLIEFGRTSPQHAEFEKHTDEFVKLTGSFRERFVDAQYRRELGNYDRPKWSNHIRDPFLTQNFLREEDKRRLGVTDAQLVGFPDALACSRWFRLGCWYMLRRAIRGANYSNDLNDAANDHADANYAFLASYTGHLATCDQDLQDAAYAICPTVTIWEWQPRKGFAAVDMKARWRIR